MRFGLQIKIINYIPTYSGEEYPKFNEITFIIPFILILATMQTKLGAKFNILIDRTMNLITGKGGEEQPQQQGQQQGQNVVRVSQPLAGQHQPSQADYLDRNQLLPSNPQMSSMPSGFAPPQQQQTTTSRFLIICINKMNQWLQMMAAVVVGAHGNSLM